MLRICVVVSAEISEEIKPVTCVVDKALTCAVVKPGIAALVKALICFDDKAAT
jgi:hypothetical protein